MHGFFISRVCFCVHQYLGPPYLSLFFELVCSDLKCNLFFQVVQTIYILDIYGFTSMLMGAYSSVIILIVAHNSSSYSICNIITTNASQQFLSAIGFSRDTTISDNTLRICHLETHDKLCFLRLFREHQLHDFIFLETISRNLDQDTFKENLVLCNTLFGTIIKC